MENPASWGKLEHTISDALTAAQKAHAEGYVGWSMTMQIAHALREAGLVREDATS